MRKILFVTHHYLTGNGGGIFASRAYINAFCELCECITLLYPIKDGEVAQGINPEVNCVPVPYSKPKVFKFVDLLLGRMHRYFGIIEKYLASGDYDTVIFDTSIVTWKNIDIVHKYGAKVITIHHNYQYEYSRDNTKGLIKFLTLFWIKKYEREALRKSDLNLTLTEEDKELLRGHYDSAGTAKIAVVGTFEYIRRSLPEISNKIRIGRYIITGTLSAVQSYESISSWIYDYYPILKDSFGFCSLTIAGKDPSDKLISLCKKNGITVVANPISIDEVIKNADVYLCPVSVGGGMKLRILDGLKSGKPVITHEVSARGYDSVINKCLFSYFDRNSFATCLERIQNIEYDANDIQKLFFKSFSFECGLERLRSILESSFLN